VSLTEQPALALLEFSSIAIGVMAGDAMVKRAPVEIACAGTIHPGNYLVLLGGDVACVDESYQAGLDAGYGALLDEVFLPSAHSEVVEALLGRRNRASGEALGIIETLTVAATVGAADRALKGADVNLVEIKLADNLGGKGYCVFSGPLAEVEAAVDLAVQAVIPCDKLVAQVVIPQFHEEMLANVESAPEFWTRIRKGGA
jgi:microcompartment protein CcmL/EutN